MYCIRCGLIKAGSEHTFVCGDCKKFSKVITEIYDDVEKKLQTLAMIDPENTPIFRLLADSVFITALNPQTRIFYKMCESFVDKAIHDQYEITEEELNRDIRTTRGWTDALRIFEELNLINVRLEKYGRVIVLEDKVKKFAKQFFTDKPMTEQLTKRLAHIYAGYLLLYILTIVAQMFEEADIRKLPYSRRPQTLWVVLMYIWLKAFDDEDKFSSEEMRDFIAKRRIPSTTRGQIIRSLQTIDGKTVQGLIKSWRVEDGALVFVFDDYVMIEMERIRELVRERER